MTDKTKEKLLEELLNVQKMLEERTETQGQMIKRFQRLVANEGLFSQVIDFFPYPIAIFTPEYSLTLVNKAFEAETKTQVSPEQKDVRILPYKIDNVQLATGITRVFDGETSFFEDLKNPFAMFSGIEVSELQANRFSKAVIFPVPSDDVRITHGVIVFMP